MRDKIIISKIQNYITKILEYTNDYDYDAFIKNSMLVEACVFNLSQIGELSNKISQQFRVGYPKLPWNQMYGLRNRILQF